MISEKNYRPDIDGLRAVAVLLVIAYHAHIPGFSGGFVGVDVFFVISGFLITRMLSDEIIETGTVRLGNFYAKRIRRLFPAAAFVLIGCILLWALFLTGVKSDTLAFIKSIKYSVAGLANLYFYQNTGGYFDNASDEMPLLHMWSLAVEEQFYLLWPFLLLLVPRKSKNHLVRRNLIILLIICVAISFVASAYFVHADENFRSIAFYSMPLRAWELGIGGLLVFCCCL